MTEFGVLVAHEGHLAHLADLRREAAVSRQLDELRRPRRPGRREAGGPGVWTRLLRRRDATRLLPCPVAAAHAEGCA